MFHKGRPGRGRLGRGIRRLRGRVRSTLALTLQRVAASAPGVGGTSLRSATASAAAYSVGLSTDTPTRADTRSNAVSAPGTRSRRDPSAPDQPPARTDGPFVLGRDSRSCPPAGRHGRARSSRPRRPCKGPRPAAPSNHRASPRLRSSVRHDADSDRGGCSRALATPGSRPPPALPRALPPSAIAPASRDNAESRARPASVAASPPRRGSRTGLASASMAGRVRALQTRRAGRAPQARTLDWPHDEASPFRTQPHGLPACG
jgi:hypothetical protein